MSKLVSALYGSVDAPILVVGGGMRAPAELEQLRQAGQQFGYVLSANGHAFKHDWLPDVPKLIVSNDDWCTTHNTPMEPMMRVHGVPIISRHWWADYRMADWDYQGNSGLNAILLACRIAGACVPIGFDFYQEGTYWHDPNAKNVSRGKPYAEFASRIMKLKSRAGHTTIRPLSGPLARTFTPWSGPFEVSSLQRPALRDDPYYVAKVLSKFSMPFDDRTRVPRGATFAISEREAKHLTFVKNCEIFAPVKVN